MNKNKNIWVIIPAAGVGKRMGSNTPKQYLQLNNKTIIEHTFDVFDKHESISEIVVAVSEGDEYWPSLNINVSKPLHIANGGKERSDSVLNGLKCLENKAADDDWVLVHDAARPCLRKEDLSLLIDSLSEHAVGGILAIPVRDTMKRSTGEKSIKATVDRENLWHALTPQMFHYSMLKNSLESAISNNQVVTDESSALELAGFQPALVEGHADNLKVTRPEDLALASFYLQKIYSEDK